MSFPKATSLARKSLSCANHFVSSLTGLLFLPQTIKNQPQNSKSFVNWAPDATPSSITSARFFAVLHLPRMIISILKVASNLMTSLYLGLFRPSMAANTLSSSYPKPTLMKKNSLPSSRRYVPRLILAHFRISDKASRQRFISQFLPTRTL